MLGLPTQLSFDFIPIESIPEIVTGSVLHIGDQRSILLHTFSLCMSKSLDEQLQKVDISFFTPPSDVVVLSPFAHFQDLPNRLCVVIDIEPVSDIDPFAIDRQGLFFDTTVDHARDKFFFILMGAIVVAAMGEGDRETVGFGIGPDKMVRRRFRCRIGRIRAIGRVFKKFPFHNRSIHFIGRHMVKMDFWETADQYGSHPHLNAGMKRVGRNRVVLLTKTHAATAEEMWADLDRFRKELGTDFIDVVLLHCMMSGNWPEERQGAMEVLSKAKEKGIIRAHGVSCHTLEALKVAANQPWVEVDLARVNPIQAHMDADPPTVISVLQNMKKKGKGVIGMKILGAGQLTHDVNRGVEHAIKLDCLDAFTIGFSRREHLEEVVQKISRLAIA